MRRYRNIENYSASHQRRILHSLRTLNSDDTDSDEDVQNNVNNFQHDDMELDDASSNSSFDHSSDSSLDDSYSSDLSLDDSSDSSHHNSFSDLSYNQSDDEIEEDYFDALDTSDDEDTDHSDIENENPHINDDPPLFPGCPLTLTESLLSILSLTLRHAVTGVLLVSILELIKLHCPQPNNCVETLYMFKKYFEDFKTPINKHFYCKQCLNRLVNENQQCPNCIGETDHGHFLTVPIISQLESLYARQGFREKLNHRFTRVKLVEENLEDIYDGTIYQQLSKPGEILSEENNISFCWYTDGVQVFKASKFSFWPLYLVINELPYSERYKKENLILAAMWFGEEKPSPNLFLLPLYDELRLLKNGVDLKIPDNEDPINVKGIIICGTCDLPAKAKFLDMTQYNGKYGCPKCKQRGKAIGKIQVYPYHKNLKLRTEQETLRQAEEAERPNPRRRKKRPVCGVKGFSIISMLVYKWITTTAIDVMHCVFEGVMKLLMKLWFSPKYADQPFSLFKDIDVIDERLLKIKPPGFVQRRPRSIKQHLKYWKASELKNFFFYYALIILEDKLSTECLDHFRLLVGAVFLLSQQSISKQMILDATRMIKEFVQRFQNIYGMRYMTCNIHSLLHLPSIVENLGPLWVYSCFAFEDINGKLKALVNGSKNAELQIYNGLSMYVNTFTLNKEFLNEGTKVYEFCKKQLCAVKKMRLDKIGNSLFIVGGLSKMKIPDHILAIFQENGIHGNKLKIFKKLLKSGTVYMSEIYTRAKVTNSMCAKYNKNGVNYYGIIHMFIRVTNCQCRNVCECPSMHYAIVKKFVNRNAFPNLCITVNFRFDYIQKIEEIQGEYDIIDVESLILLCFYLPIERNNLKYAVEIVNNVEKE